MLLLNTKILFVFLEKYVYQKLVNFNKIENRMIPNYTKFGIFYKPDQIL